MGQSPLDRLLNRPAPTGTATFAFDPTAAAELAEAQRAAETAEAHAASHPQQPAAKKAANVARKRADALRAELVTVTWTVRAIGADAMEQLEAEHPATDEQTAAATAAEEQAAMLEGRDPRPVHLAFNQSTFPPAMLAASVVSVVFSDDEEHPITDLTVDDAGRIYRSLTRMDQLELLSMCQAINIRGTQVEALGKG